MAKGFNPNDLEKGGTVRERVTFWKGEKAGDWLIGRLTGFTSKLFDGNKEESTIAVFQPCAVALVGGWHNVREAQVILSAALVTRISRTADIGQVFAIRFDGTEPTTKGNDARLYTVVVQTEEKLAAILSEAEA